MTFLSSWQIDFYYYKMSLFFLIAVFALKSILLGTGLPRWRSGKESTCPCRRHKRLGFDPWVGKIPRRRKWQPTAVCLPGESHGRRSLARPWSIELQRVSRDWAGARGFGSISPGTGSALQGADKQNGRLLQVDGWAVKVLAQKRGDYLGLGHLLGGRDLLTIRIFALKWGLFFFFPVRV